jgi:hypothetical protein
MSTAPVWAHLAYLITQAVFSSRTRHRIGYVCVISEGFQFRRPWVPKLGTRASPSKVDEKDTTGQLAKDCMIG